MEKWQTDSLVKHWSWAISLIKGKTEGRRSALLNSSSFKPFSLWRARPSNPGGEIFTCNRSNRPKLANSVGNKFTSFAKNLTVLSPCSCPTHLGSKLNSFLYRYKSLTEEFDFSRRGNSRFFPDTSRTESSSEPALSPGEPRLSARSSGFSGDSTSSFSCIGGYQGTNSPERQCEWRDWEERKGSRRLRVKP